MICPLGVCYLRYGYQDSTTFRNLTAFFRGVFALCLPSTHAIVMLNLKQLSLTFLLVSLYVTISKCAANEDSHENFVWAKEEYPNPLINHLTCRQKRPSTLCNADDVINFKQTKDLDKIIKRIAQDTKCICNNGCRSGKGGLVVGVALMKFMAKGGSGDQNKYVKDYVDYLRKTWKMGQCDNDILILVVTHSHQIATSVGKNATEILPEAILDKILEQTKDHFKSGFYYQGLESILNSFYDSIPKPEPSHQIGLPQVVVITGTSFGVVFLIIILCGIVCCCRRKLKRSESELINRKYRLSKIEEEDSHKADNEDAAFDKNPAYISFRKYGQEDVEFCDDHVSEYEEESEEDEKEDQEGDEETSSSSSSSSSSSTSSAGEVSLGNSSQKVAV